MYSRWDPTYWTQGWLASAALHATCAVLLYAVGNSSVWHASFATQSGKASVELAASTARRPAAQELDAPVLRVLASHSPQGHEQPLAVLRPQVESVARRTDVNQPVVLAIAALPDLREAEQTGLDAPHAVSLTLPGPQSSELHFEQRRNEPAHRTPRSPPTPAEVDAVASLPSMPSKASRGANDQQPAAVFNPAPAYPASALAARQTGRVLIRVVIDVQGWVTTATVHRSSGVTSLDEAALVAVRQWRFRSAMKNGQAVEHEFAVPVRFVLAGL